MTTGVHIERASIGEAWLAVAAAVLDRGARSSWGGLPNLELLQVTLHVTHPAADDPIIARYADEERLAWMHANFTDHARVAELGSADSYATRLYDYARSGRDQVHWIIDRLAADATTRDATITTFQPLTDTSYVPCVSLLDFWLADGRLHHAVYAHGIDFGTKGYANLVELADLQQRIAAALGADLGALTMTVKTAHVYDTERAAIRAVLDTANSEQPARSR